jgi:histidine triad (HIT) family protein
MSKECLFCKIANNEAPSFKVYEDDYFIAILDIFPKGLGHTLIIPKKHSKDMTLVTDNETLKRLGPLVTKISSAIDKELKPDGLFVRTNIREAAGQVVFHTHVHIVPVFKKEQDKDVSEELAQRIKKSIV